MGIGLELPARYALFAGIATLVNLLTQEAGIRVYDGDHAIAVSVLAGTGTGLVTKYLLDKHFIFRFKSRSALHEGRVFVFYTAMSVLTTLIFWGTEFAFHVVWETKLARYTGAVVGLTAGYVIKYRLDKRYVFRR